MGQAFLTRRVQRLLQPAGTLDHPGQKVPTAFAYGDARRLEKILTLDDMMVPDFADTAVADAFDRFIENHDALATDYIHLTVSRDEREGTTTPLYLIAPAGDLMDYAKNFIGDDARYGYAGHRMLAAPTHLRKTLLGDARYAAIGGWLEMEHGFMFFRDWTMFDGMARFFGIDQPYPDPAAPVKAWPAAAAATLPAPR